MRRNNVKKGLYNLGIELLFLAIGVVFLLYIALPMLTFTSQDSLFRMGASQAIKQTRECIAFNDAYVAELKKGQQGHPNVIIEEAKAQHCKK